MNVVEKVRIVLASAILLLLILSSSGAMFATYFLLGFYVLVSTLVFMGIVMKMANYPLVPPSHSTSKGSVFVMQSIHLVAMTHIYLLGFTIISLPIITIIAISMIANLIERREPL